MSTVLTITETAADPQRDGALARIFKIQLANDGTGGTAGRLLIEDPTVIEGSESLTNGGLASGTNWTDAGDATLANNQLEYVDSTNAGTLTQAAADLAVALEGFTYYAFTYTISGLVGAPAGTITTGIAEAAVTLDMSAGTHTVEFRTKAVPGDFVLSFTSTNVPDPEEFIMDNLSLVQVRNYPLAQFPAAGTQHLFREYTFDEPWRVENGFNAVIVGWDQMQVTIQYE